MEFKVGQLVQINPNWDRKKGNYGIDCWRDYVNKIFEIDWVRCSKDYYLKNNIFTWPGYMLMPANEKSIQYLLWRRNEHSGR